MTDPLPRPTVAGMIARIAPGWTLHERERLPAGHHHTERLTVETPDGPREAVLKAAPADEQTGLGLETRLLSILGAHTAVPVPEVYGVVDDHDDHPSPFALLEAVSGRTVSETRAGSLSPATVDRVARSVGRHLAALHDFDAVETFGFLDHCDVRRDGGRPSSDPSVLTVADPTASWPALLREWADERLATLSEGRFSDLVPDARSALEERFAALEGPFEPVLAHVDCSIDNVPFDADGATALLDWEFTLAAPPAYDLVFVEHSLAGGSWSYAPPAPDLRTRVSGALREGYAASAGPRPPGNGRALYELFACLNSMTLFEDWYATLGLDEHVDGAARGHRREFERLVRADGA